MASATQKKKKVEHEGCVSFEVFKQSLGSAVSNYSDEEIEHIRITFDKLADLAFDGWLRKRNTGIVIDNHGH